MNVGRLGRGEVLAVLGGIPLVFVLSVGAVARPGEPSGEISLRLGWFPALLGTVLEIAAGATRAGSAERPRKPSGVL